MGKIISGIQQMGIGIPDVHEAWSWYRKHLKFDVPVFEEAAEAALMVDYTGGSVQARHAILALNMQGGGGFEIWQFTSRTPQAADEELELGDLGINACKIKCRNAEDAHTNLKEHVTFISAIQLDPIGCKNFYVKDPYGNLFQIIESDNWFGEKGNIGGVYGAIIGVSNIEKAKELYSNILGYDQVLFEGESEFKDFGSLTDSNPTFRRSILTHSKPREGGFSKLLGSSQIELVELQGQQPKKIYNNRFWGDLGFIHLCFDVVDMKALRSDCEAGGFPFTVDSDNSFDMGEAAGHFSYVEDPDGTLIEFVETHKIPIVKKIGWYLDMRKRDPKKALPNWMVKSLGLNRKK